MKKVDIILLIISLLCLLILVLTHQFLQELDKAAAFLCALTALLVTGGLGLFLGKLFHSYKVGFFSFAVIGVGASILLWQNWNKLIEEFIKQLEYWFFYAPIAVIFIIIIILFSKIRSSK